MAGSSNKRAAFVTIGQTPRVDLTPEMAKWIGGALDIVERGALDGISRSEIERFAPSAGQHRLVTRLADGSQVVVRKSWVRERVQHVLDDAARERFDLTVLLCTGYLPELQAPGLFLEAQAIVDHAVMAMTRRADSVGVMVPLEEQIEEFHFQPREGQVLRLSHASPYRPGRLEQAGRQLADVDVVVMHCMGYTGSMRETVASASGRPVLLARRLVAAAVGQLV